MQLLRRPAAVVLWALIVLLAILGSVAFHGSLPLARRATAEGLGKFVSGEIAGELRIGRLDELGPHRVVARHVALYDADGRRVAIADTVELVPDLAAALKGTLRFGSARLRGGTVRLIDGEELPTLIELFDTGPPSPGPPLHSVVDDIRLEDVTVYGEVLGLEGIRVEGLRAHGRLEIREDLEIRIWSASGEMVRPYPFTAHIDRVVGRIHDDAHEGVRLHVQAHTDTDRLRANVGFAVPEGKPAEDPGELDLLLHAMPMQARTLHQVGFDWAELLRGEARGHLRLHGPADDLRLRASLETDGGPAQLEGHFPEQGESVVRARTSGVALERLIEGAPALQAAGRASLHVPEAEGADSRVQLELEPFRYDGYQVPALRIEGALEEEAFRVDRAVGRHGGNRIEGRGRVGYDGRTDLRVRAQVPQVAREPNLARLLPDMRARLEADMALSTATEQSDRIDFEGRIVLRDLVYGPITADWLAVEGFAKGNPERPEARLDLDGRGVAVAGYPLGTADLNLRGGPRKYVTTGRFEAPGGRRVKLDADIEATRERYVLDARRIELNMGELVWRGAAERVVIHPERDVVIERMLLASGSQRLEAEGIYRFEGPEQLEAQLQNFDLTGLRALFGDLAPDVAGNADAHLTLEGDIEAPTLVLEGALRDTAYQGVQDVDVVYVLTYGDGQAALDAQVDLRDRGTVMVTTSALIDPDEGDLATALENGVYELELAVAELDLDVLRKLAGEGALPPGEGRLAGRVTASGPIQAPSFEGTLQVPELQLPGWPAVAVRTDLHYESGALGMRLMTEDDGGELVEAEASVLLDLTHMAAHPEDALAMLEAVPWRLSVRMPTRTVGELPAPVRRTLPEALEPLTMSVSGTLAGGSFATHGDLVAHLGWNEDLSHRPCGQGARPRATISAKLQEETARMEVSGHLGSELVLLAEGTARVALDAWLRQGEPPTLPAVDATAELRQLDLGKVPWACETLAGPVSGTVELTDLFAERPRARAALATNRLVVRRFRDETLRGTWSLNFETPPMEGTLDLAADHSQVRGNAALQWWQGGSADVMGSLPVRWGVGQAVPEAEAGAPLKLQADLTDVPLALLLSTVPNLVDVEGTVSGRLATEGKAEDPQLRGRLNVGDGYFQVMPMGQQIGGVEGDLIFHGDWVELRRLVAREREGGLNIRGTVRLDGVRPTSGQLELKADDFPVRSEGAVLADVTGVALVDAAVGEDRSVARVTLRDMALLLPDEGLRTVQELEPHPDVSVEGTQLRDTSETEPYPVVIGVKSAQPFWVRRTDFAALVSMDLGVTYLDPDLFVDGSVAIRRGFFEVFGKRFEVRQAGLQFDGGREINPEVNLQAVHELRNGAAETVTVTVTGRLARPQVDFATTVAGCQDRGDIIALLVTGRCARSGREGEGGVEQAGQQAASFLAGVAYGVLTLSAREQLGKNFPMIVIESGQFGRPIVRAGIDASGWIPKPLKPFVQGAYVEGFFTASRDDGQQRSSTAQGRDNGFLLELQFPRNIVGTGVFSPPDNWSLDLTWEP
ncbi:MAG: translocation/assembly module TamB domain-containing protein [Myxococcota bacterium]